jgi:micrococcal nuclease
MSNSQKTVLNVVVSLSAAILLVVGLNVDLFGWMFAGEEQSTTEPKVATATVSYVFDGDTIKVNTGTSTESVRLIGIDTPEMNWPQDEGTPAECYAKDARQFLQTQLAGKTVRLVSDSLQPKRDKHDRRLAYVYQDGELVNSKLLAEGYADLLKVQPGFSKQASFANTRDTAQKDDRGLWSACQ